MRVTFLLLLVMFVATLTIAHLATPAAAPAPKAEPKEPALKLQLQASPLAVQFLNVSKDPIRILKPVDGSEWCWIMPHYKLTVINEHDHEIGYAARCGNYGFPYSETKWPDDYVVTIRPGHSYTHHLWHNHNIRETGKYQLRFEYVFTPKAKGIFGGHPYPADLWRGTAVSNTIEVRLESNAPKAKLQPGE